MCLELSLYFVFYVEDKKDCEDVKKRVGLFFEMDYANLGERLLVGAPEWIDDERALSAMEMCERMQRLPFKKQIAVQMLMIQYRRLPTVVWFFHGYLHDLAGETFFRDFVRFANAQSVALHP